MCALLVIFNIVTVFLTLKEHHYKSNFSATISFFVLLVPGLTSFRGVSGLCFNQSQELWGGLPGLVFQNVGCATFLFEVNTKKYYHK